MYLIKNHEILLSNLGMDPELVLTVPQKTMRFRKRLKRVPKSQRIDEDRTSSSALQYVELGNNVHERPGTFSFPKYLVVIDYSTFLCLHNHTYIFLHLPRYYKLQSD